MASLARVHLCGARMWPFSIVPAYRFVHVFTGSRGIPNNANIFKVGLRYAL
jgi:hypothetical protein